MTVFSSIPDLAQTEGSLSLAIGVFDGVHLGHRAVIGEAVRLADEWSGSSVTVTFDPNPAVVLGKGPAKRVLTSTRHKEDLIEELGADHFLVISFTREFAELTPEEFIDQLVKASEGRLKQIVVGADWRFGKGRAGDLALLKELGEKRGFEVTGIEAVEVDSLPVSSTRIREAVADGDFKAAETLLGRPFSVQGEVIKGRKMGRQLGFPTANLKVWNEVLPPEGVYVVEVEHTELGLLPGVANLGRRPTVEGDAGRLLLEVHLLKFSEEIYGDALEVTFLKKLRGERKFDGLESLKEQIGLDRDEAEEWFAVRG